MKLKQIAKLISLIYKCCTLWTQTLSSGFIFEKRQEMTILCTSNYKTWGEIVCSTHVLLIFLLTINGQQMIPPYEIIHYVLLFMMTNNQRIKANNAPILFVLIPNNEVCIKWNLIPQILKDHSLEGSRNASCLHRLLIYIKVVLPNNLRKCLS